MEFESDAQRRAVFASLADKGGGGGKIRVGNVIHARGTGASGKVIGKGSIRYGKKQIEGYRIRKKSGAVDFIPKEDSILSKKGRKKLK
jgi:hypothetical protein